MDVSDIVDLARNYAVLVKVHGPDPKGLKMRKHAFHQYTSGNTTLSASGMMLPDNLYDVETARRMIGVDDGQKLALVVTASSVIEPFLSLQHRECISEGRPELIRGAQIEIMVESKTKPEKSAPCWFAAQLLSLVDVPVSSLALQSLIEASSGPAEYGWEVGWSLGSQENGARSSTATLHRQIDHGNKSFMESRKLLAVGDSRDPNIIAKSATRVAVLAVFPGLEEVPNINLSLSDRRGDFLLAVGSPFGILSPVHFLNSISTGSIANSYPPTLSKRSLLMADMRCLPGMEGSPVFNDHAHFIGILVRPLRQKNNGAEIQLVIPWEAIASARSDLLLKEPLNPGIQIDIFDRTIDAAEETQVSDSAGPDNFFYDKHGHPNIGFPPVMPVLKAVTSICLITIDDGLWASGVVLNDQGLILTNAHLLEPWRFRKANINNTGSGNDSVILPYGIKEPSSPTNRGADKYQEDHSLLPQTWKNGSLYGDHRSIRVRLDHVDPWIWCDAKVVYICKGPLDTALLQLEHVPDQLCPIVPEFGHPPLGSKAFVIGHGLFGPRCGSSPSVCSGVVAKTVKAKLSPYYQAILKKDSEYPAMLETTASVHPGGSGGAIVNSKGHMIGLVTSNARHGGGTLIPHLNFSIPCAVLAPVFEFAKDMKDISLLQNLDQPNEALSSAWAMVPPLTPKPNPPLRPQLRSILDNNTKEPKGARFAKFLAETQKMNRNSSSQLDNTERPRSEFLPCKL